MNLLTIQDELIVSKTSLSRKLLPSISVFSSQAIPIPRSGKKKPRQEVFATLKPPLRLTLI